MGREFRECPDGIQVENYHINQIILALMGKQGQGIPIRATEVSDANLWALDARNHTSPGQHIRATHSSGSPVLFSVTDAGVLLSTSGGAASNSLIYQKMVVGWTGTAASVPSGYTIVAASKNAFPYGANVDGDLGATGGSATYDISHTHTGPSHTHTGPSHNHSGTSSSDGTGSTSSDGGGSTSSDGTGNTSTDGGGSTSSDGTGATGSSGTGSTSSDGTGVTSQPSILKSVTDDGTNQTNVADNNHTHTGPSHNHTGPAHTHTGPSHNHTGPSHFHSGPSHSHSGPTHTHSGPSHNHTLTTSSDGTGATGASGTGATGTSGSAAQSILPPFWRCYWIERTVA